MSGATALGRLLAGELDLQEVSVARAGVRIVREVTLRAHPGEVTLLLGPNGAGKTTLLEAISGVLPVAGGRICLGGQNLARLNRVARARRGVVHVEQGRTVFGSLTVAQNLRVVGGDPDAARRALELFPELRARLRTPAASLSGGEQQMLSLARALTAEPRVLLLDEMSLGLAPVVVRRLLPAARLLAGRGVTVLLVEQFAHLALEHADRAYVLAGGRLTYSGPAQPLRAAPAALHRAYLGADQSPTTGNTRADANGAGARPERDTFDEQ